MGLSQTMITAAFLVLLTVAVYNANKMIVDKNENYYKQEAIKEAGYLASALLTEISKKKFHSAIDTSTKGYLSTSSFSPSTFGAPDVAKKNINPDGRPDSLYPFKSLKENDPNYFDDIDDYDGYLRSADNISALKGFMLKVSVYYVDSLLNTLPKTSPTYLKKIDVKVWNPYYLVKYRTSDAEILDTLLFTTIISF